MTRAVIGALGGMFIGFLAFVAIWTWIWIGAGPILAVYVLQWFPDVGLILGMLVILGMVSGIIIGISPQLAPGDVLRIALGGLAGLFVGLIAGVYVWNHYEVEPIAEQLASAAQPVTARLDRAMIVTMIGPIVGVLVGSLLCFRRPRSIENSE